MSARPERGPTTGISAVASPGQAGEPRQRPGAAALLARHLARPRDLARLLVLGEIVGERPARGQGPWTAPAPGRPPRQG